MSGSTILLPLLLLLSGSSASNFNGGTMTFNPKGVNADGSYTVRPQNYGGNWITTVEGDISWKLQTTVDLGVRSDTGTANRSPQTTVIPLLLVPVNCPRDFQLLAHDPDGDLVQCRLGLSGNQECADCSLPVPSIFTLKSPCTLSYLNTSNSVGNTYAVQLMMEDFPTASITLTYKDGSLSNRNPSSPLSKLPVQFAVTVGAAVPSCAEGEYLPRFLSPTPAYGTHFYIAVNNTLEISVRAEANLSM
ncbi:uncharacterized protein LOC134025142 [Osmerus eperlanus]|uniref:uncharacterized protein LOC134025142 n=1 Tax=Osmerus eperlanus TaxID=29151 RepID=UPI002E0F88E3